MKVWKFKIFIKDETTSHWVFKDSTVWLKETWPKWNDGPKENYPLDKKTTRWRKTVWTKIHKK